MKRSRTQRGFALIEFEDIYGEKCSLQKSSLATEAAIWLGQEQPTKTNTGEIAGCRMHLNQRKCRWLIKELQHFIDTGEIKGRI